MIHKLLKPGGKLVAFGFYNAVMGKGGSIPMDFMRIMLWNILPNQKRASFYSIGGLRKKHPEWFKKDLKELFELLKKGTCAQQSCDTPAGASTAYSTTRLALAAPFSLMKSQRVSPVRAHTAGTVSVKKLKGNYYE